jgi:hypothetical protein
MAEARDALLAILEKKTLMDVRDVEPVNSLNL